MDLTRNAVPRGCHIYKGLITSLRLVPRGNRRRAWSGQTDTPQYLNSTAWFFGLVQTR